MANFQQITGVYLRSRESLKQRLAYTVGDIEAGIRQGTLNKTSFKRQNDVVIGLLGRIGAINDNIDSVCATANIEYNHPDIAQNHFNETNYLTGINNIMAGFDEHFEAPPPPVSSNRFFKLNVDTPRYNARNPDPLAFKNFYHQFKSCVEADPSLPDSMKLTMLKASIENSQVIAHLSNDGDNYAVALALVEREFMDKDHLQTVCLGKILNSSPQYDAELEGHKKYLTEVRACVEELRTSHNLDFLAERTGGAALGFAVFQKLPNILKRALIDKTGSNFPGLNEILDNFTDLIKTLRITRYVPKHDKGSNKTGASKASKGSNETSITQNFSTNEALRGDKEYSCRFCTTKGHTALICPRYNTPQTRLDRCSILGLCPCCTSNKHGLDQCSGKDNKLSYPCRVCKSRSHVSAMCPKFVSKHNSDNQGGVRPKNSADGFMGVQVQPHILPVKSL